MRLFLSVQACRLDVGEPFADLRKKWCCMGTQNIVYVVSFFPHSDFFLEDKVFSECGFPLSIRV